MMDKAPPTSEHAYASGKARPIQSSTRCGAALLAAAANGVGRGGRGRGGVGGASKDRAEVVSALLHAPNPAGVLDAAMPDGRTALVLATSRGNVAMVKALLGAGATAGLSAALEAAVASREPDLIQLLSVSRDGERDM